MVRLQSSNVESIVGSKNYSYGDDDDDYCSEK